MCHDSGWEIQAIHERLAREAREAADAADDAESENADVDFEETDVAPQVVDG